MRKILFLACILGFPCSVFSQSVGSWANLTSIQPGQKIEIVDSSSKKHSGTFTNASDSAISFSQAGGQHSIQKQDVREVKLLNTHRTRNILIWTGVGAGAGAGIGAAATGHGGNILLSVSHAKGAAVGAALGAGGGVAVGALVHSHSTVYRVGQN